MDYELDCLVDRLRAALRSLIMTDGGDFYPIPHVAWDLGTGSAAQYAPLSRLSSLVAAVEAVAGAKEVR